MTESDTLTDSIYWGIHPLDSVLLDSEQDTICVSVKGEKVAFWRFNYVLPYSESGSIYPLPDTCYVYVIKWNIAVYTNLKVYHFLIKKCTTPNRLQRYA